MLDAGLDLGKTAEQSLTLLRASATLAALGYPLLLSASNKTFLGKILDLELTERREASIGAAALGIAWGCRIVRVHDVKGTCRARDVLAAVSEARVTAARSQSVYLVKGDDAALVAQAVRVLLDDVVGDGDHALIVEEVGGGAGDELSVGAVVDACLTPPFLVDRRVVVVREAGRLLTADAPRLVEVVQDPLPSTVLILVGGGGTIPAPLVKAISAAGQVIDVTTSKAGDRKAWLHDHLRAAPVKLEPRAADCWPATSARISAASRASSSALSAAYGEGARVTADDLAPYLGEAGNVPRYELTDAIDKGEPGRALTVLRRMLEAGGLAPVQVLTTLHLHFSNMLLLDGDDVSTDQDAAAILGTAPFVAKKALQQSRRLGSTRIAEADQPDRGRRPRRARGERHGRRGRDRDPGGPVGPPDPPGAGLAPAGRRPPLGRPPAPARCITPAATRTTSGGSRGPGRRTRAGRRAGRVGSRSIRAPAAFTRA